MPQIQPGAIDALVKGVQNVASTALNLYDRNQRQENAIDTNNFMFEYTNMKSSFMANAKQNGYQDYEAKFEEFNAQVDALMQKSFRNEAQREKTYDFQVRNNLRATQGELALGYQMYTTNEAQITYDNNIQNLIASGGGVEASNAITNANIQMMEQGLLTPAQGAVNTQDQLKQLMTNNFKTQYGTDWQKASTDPRVATNPIQFLEYKEWALDQKKLDENLRRVETEANDDKFFAPMLQRMLDGTLPESEVTTMVGRGGITEANGKYF